MLPSTYIRSTETYLAESVIACFFDRDSGFRVFGSKYMENTENICTDLIPIQAKANTIPLPPPLPKSAITSHFQKSRVSSESLERGYSCVSTATRDLWDGLFDEAYGADVYIHTDHGGIVYAHAYILGMTSPVLKGMLKQSKKSGRKRSISIHGVPPDAVKVFIRYLYSCRYEKEEMEEFVLPLLMLSHVYVVPQLKRECERQLGRGLLTLENVVDVFQLALLCDAPRLSLLCHRMILKNFKAVSSSEAWQAMQQSHPVLEKELLGSVVDEDNRQKKRVKKMNERKIYLELFEAMETLVHICRDGCRTIGPHDKDFKVNQPPCKYAACKGLELLIRHFAGCKLRAPGGCTQCKRMWQLLELHSHLCADSNLCRVPLCRNFKDRSKKQGRKDEVKWKLLVKKILWTKGVARTPFFLTTETI
ncbi:BTB/POZ and TAZ domain-containing protein 4 isoform X2 [Cucumis melo]|uniref:BTB/POZ and TAZ domain-containing protein 4 isoform X2 n=1 Tax=Cucumis melo TaxID=3656 RepID=A0A1S3B1L9_CUCME|nr:BTB/POZ and TAZ domain-containing protein 4 isoform X2 [Cucumis melo]XP_050944742.1 BTB/POZ and TAZ domain-containing protein 4 isoform X2 [Cucumis melo]